MMGAGILSLPHAGEHAGIVMCALLLILMAVMQDLSCWMLLSALDHVKEISYGVAAQVLYGRPVGIMVDVMVCLGNFGVLTSYVVILGDLVPPFMRFIDAPGLLQDRTTLVLLISGSVLLPLSSLRNMGALNYASFVCLVVILTFVVIVFLMGIEVIPAKEPTDTAPLLLNTNIVSILQQLPVIIFTYNCNSNVPILYGELRRRVTESRWGSKKAKMMSAMHASLAVCCSLYCIACIFGALAFADRAKSDILLNWDVNVWAPSPYFRALYSIVVACSYPVMCFSCVASLHRLVWHLMSTMAAHNGESSANVWRSQHDRVHESLGRSAASDHMEAGGTNPTQHTWADSPLSVALQEKEISAPVAKCWVHQLEVVIVLVCSVTLGIVATNLSTVFDLTGGVCGSFIGFIFPGLMFIRTHRGHSVAKQILGGCVLTFGVAVSVFTIFTTACPSCLQ